MGIAAKRSTEELMTARMRRTSLKNEMKGIQHEKDNNFFL